MEEINNENLQYKYEEVDRPFNYGKNYPKSYDWKKYGPGGYGPKWPGMHGGYFPGGGYGPYFPGGYYGGAYGWPWLLLALKSLSPRDLARYIDEMDDMNL